jgi:hypothetical protein
MNWHQHVAEKAVAAFKESLDDDARSHLTEAQFDELTRLVQEAITEELTAAAELIEEAARRLRAETERPEFGL